MVNRLEKSMARWFLVIGGAAVLGAVVVYYTNIPTGMLGPLAGAASVLLASAVAFSQLQQAAGWQRALAALLLLIILGAAAEITGLEYGTFGRYHYTNLWWPIFKLPDGKNFPLFVPLCWFYFVAACYLALPARLAPWARVLGGAALCAAIDFGLEPVLAGPVRFWIWEPAQPPMLAPLQNTGMWFLVSLAGCAILAVVGIRPQNGRVARTLLLAVIGFSIVIGLLFGMFGVLATLPVAVVLAALQILDREPQVAEIAS